MNPPDVVQLNRETLSLENYASAVVTSNLARSINLAIVDEKYAPHQVQTNIYDIPKIQC
jgi:hypothetical protein